MRKYVRRGVEAWKHHYEDWPPDEWRALYKDIIAAIGSDPKGPVAQALCDRWLSIVQGASPSAGGSHRPDQGVGRSRALARRAEASRGRIRHRACDAFHRRSALGTLGSGAARARAGEHTGTSSRQRVQAHVVSRLRLDPGFRADESGSAVSGREVAGARRGRNAGRRRAQAGRAGCALTPTRVAGWNETIHRVAV